MLSRTGLLKVLLFTTLFSAKQQWALCFQMPKFEEAVLIAPNLGLLFNASHYWLWDVAQRSVEQVEPNLTTGFHLASSPDFVWVPYASDVNTSEEQFTPDYGKICITSHNENILYDVLYVGASKTLQVVRNPSRHCDRYILSDQSSVCSFTILPILESRLHLLARYSSIFLVGHNQYSYIIFDRKYEYIDKNRLVIIRYRFNYPNDSFTNLLQPMCLDGLKEFIQLKKVTSQTMSGLKAILPLSNGTIYIFFDQQYCSTNLDSYLQCDRRNINELFSLQNRHKRSANHNRSSQVPHDSTTPFKHLQTSSQKNTERQTNSTNINEFRSAIMILVVFIISVLVILSYKLILFNRNN